MYILRVHYSYLLTTLNWWVIKQVALSPYMWSNNSTACSTKLGGALEWDYSTDSDSSTSQEFWHLYSTDIIPSVHMQWQNLWTHYQKLLSNYCIPNCTKGISGIVCIKAARQTYQDQKIKKENSFSGHLTEEVTVPVSIETQFLLLLKQEWTGE